MLLIYDVINCRKLLFLYHILNLKEDDPVLKPYKVKEQNKPPFEKNFANKVSRLGEHYNIMLRDSILYIYTEGECYQREAMNT